MLAETASWSQPARQSPTPPHLPPSLPLIPTPRHVMGAIHCFVGAYTALMFYRQPDTWAPKSEAGGKSGKAKAALAAALQSLSESHDASVCEALCAHAVVAQMRRDMQLPARTVCPGPLDQWANGPLAFVFVSGAGAVESVERPTTGAGEGRAAAAGAGPTAKPVATADASAPGDDVASGQVGAPATDGAGEGPAEQGRRRHRPPHRPHPPHPPHPTPPHPLTPPTQPTQPIPSSHRVPRTGERQAVRQE